MLEPLPGSRLRSFMLSSNGLPGLDPRMLSPASLPGRIGSGGGIRRRFSLRKIGEGNRFRLRTPVPAASFLLQQLFNAALRPTGPAPGGILNPVATVIIPLTPLAGLPELAMEPFRSIVQPTAQKLPGGGRRPAGLRTRIHKGRTPSRRVRGMSLPGGKGPARTAFR